MLIDNVIDRFNTAAAELQTSEFRRAKTHGEWLEMSENPPAHDYAKLFNAAVPLIEAFGALSPPGERAGIAAKLSPDALSILRTFAYAVSVLAVRRESPALIGQGLTALAILGEVDDTRDLTFHLARLYYSAIKLGTNAAQLFVDVAALSPSISLQDAMRGFPLRPPEYRDLRAFFLRETSTQEGFDFVRDEPVDSGRGLVNRIRDLLRT